MLTGLMVLVFLRDWRSVVVVVLNIPFAIRGAVVALWLTGQTINLRFSFEPADIVSDVMSFGSPTPVEVAVSGPNFADDLARIPSLRDLQYAQTLDYPTVGVEIDRERAGVSGVTEEEVARSLVTATSSSRFVVPNYWPDP